MVIIPYMKNTQVFMCPSSQWHCYGTNYGMAQQGLNASGVRVTTFGNSVKLGVLKRPAESMIVSEKGNGGGNRYIMSDNGTNGYYACRADHNEGGNITFCDGHVKWMKFQFGQIPGFSPPPSGYQWHPPVETFTDVL